MIQSYIHEEAKSFREFLKPLLEKYSLLLPEASWPSMSALDYLCYHLRYREDWNNEDKKLFHGMCAVLGEFVYTCWKEFHADVTLRKSSQGIECIAVLKRGLFKNEVYCLPIEASLQQIIQKPKSPLPSFGRQFVLISDAFNISPFSVLINSPVTYIIVPHLIMLPLTNASTP